MDWFPPAQSTVGHAFKATPISPRRGWIGITGLRRPTTRERTQVPQTLTNLQGHPRACTGIVGLDDVLGGGLDPNRLYLIEGEPGTGKTTLALQFLLEGVRKGERGLYVTLSESEEE